MSLNLKSGSLAVQLADQKKEFRKFVIYVKMFMQTTQQRFRDVQGSFAEALLNHETRIKALETELSVVPKQELKDELENLIIENAEVSNQMDQVNKELTDKIEEPVLPELPETQDEPVVESKILFHKEF